jgi:hypothetical protein
MSIGLVLLMITSSIGFSIIYFINSSATSLKNGAVVEVLFPSDTSGNQICGALAAEPALARAVRFTPPENANFETTEQLVLARCADLRKLTGTDLTLAVTGKPCQNGKAYRVAVPIGGEPVDSQLDLPDQQREQLLKLGSPQKASLPGLGTSFLSGATLVVTQTPQEWGDFNAAVGLLALSGRGDNAADRLVNRVLKSTPLADVSYLGIDDSLIYQIPLLNQLVTSCSIIGQLLAAGAFLVAASDRRRERRRDRTALTTIGVTRRTQILAEVYQLLVGTGLAVMLGGAVGWLAGNAYLATGGEGAEFLKMLLVEVALGVVALLVIPLSAPFFASHRVDAEDLHRA